MATNTRTPAHRLHLRVAGWVPDNWSERFDGVHLRHSSDGTTVVCGNLADQSALFGLIRAIENAGMKVVALFAYPGGVA